MKTLWKKNLDNRYISGENLQNGEEAGKGLKKEMVVTLASFNDAKTFDQNTQSEATKTAIWLIDTETKLKLYKPCLLNVTRGNFLSKEIGNDSLFLEDFDTTKPFVIFAKPDRRHGFVVAFKKYYPATIDDSNAKKILNTSKSLAELKVNWGKLTGEEKKLTTIITLKEKLKNEKA